MAEPNDVGSHPPDKLGGRGRLSLWEQWAQAQDRAVLGEINIARQRVIIDQLKNSGNDDLQTELKLLDHLEKMQAVNLADINRITDKIKEENSPTVALQPSG